jgi:hypothetical protein
MPFEDKIVVFYGQNPFDILNLPTFFFFLRRKIVNFVCLLELFGQIGGMNDLCLQRRRMKDTFNLLIN